ncbi:MAG TPA: hypothetical protein VFQ08_08745 [Gaiella sp.]|nr:hypothetical protein [Gaiella sp.]
MSAGSDVDRLVHVPLAPSDTTRVACITIGITHLLSSGAEAAGDEARGRPRGAGPDASEGGRVAVDLSAFAAR